jgi:16S rRNA (uracil1498-N3)-methyltransferase
MKRLRIDRLPLEGATLLPSDVAHHLVHVLRAPVGREVLLHDGAGLEQPARLTSQHPATVEPTGPLVARPQPGPLHLFLAVLKHQPMDLALRMAVEAGATAIHPVHTGRTVAQGDRTKRWARILDSAADQCGAARVPELHPVQDLFDALDAHPMPLRVGRPGAPAPTGVLPSPVGLVIGPAGGLTPAEESALDARGAEPIGLGPWILRAETAVAVGIGLLRASETG